MDTSHLTAFLGIDGGGTKTELVLIDEAGAVLATRRVGSAYYIEIGLSELRRLLVTAVQDLLASASLASGDVAYALIGIPAYGENSALLSQLDHVLEGVLPKARYHCANDVVCAWAGALGGGQGIAVVAGTGSIAYGEYGSSSARSGGWGELFGDEGSAFWLANRALALFSRMSDGRTQKGPLYSLVRRHFGIQDDLDLCAKVYGPPSLTRSELAALSRLLTEAAETGDQAAQSIFDSAAVELAELVHAVRNCMSVPPDVNMPASYCGGLLERNSPLLPRFTRTLHSGGRAYDLKPPRLRPAAGAAAAAARMAQTPLKPDALERLERHAPQEYGL